MDITLLILLTMVFTAITLTYWRGRLPLLIAGFKQAGDIFKSVWFRLILGLILGGLIQVLIPSQLIAEWLGPASGLKGILIASYTGLIMTGGPYVSIPVVASIYAAGAGVGPVIALLASMNLLSLPGLFTWQIPFLGARIALTRYAITFFLPPLIGLTGGAVYQLITMS